MKLNIMDSSGREMEVDLTSDPQILGRGEDSNIILGSRSVARHHLKLWLDGGTVMVEDLSGKGVDVDGEPCSGTFELEPGAEMELGIFTISIAGTVKEFDLSDESSGVHAVAAPLLVGTKGVTKGLEIELAEGANDVGRDPSLFLVIDDPSISRQHARINVEAGRFHLVDMRSSNGTFVNRKRVDAADLTSGDVVRFGNIEFQFRYGQIDSSKLKKQKKKKMILIGVGCLAGLFLIIGISKACSSKQPIPQGPALPSEPQIPVEIQVEQHLTSAKRLMEKLEWPAAKAEIESAIDIYPICKECRLLQKQIEDELETKNTYQDGMVEFDLSHWREARQVFKKIPKESAYFKKVQYKMHECEERISRKLMMDMKGFYNAHRYKEAHACAKEYMEYNRCDRKTYEKWIKGRIEKAMRSGRFPTRFEPLAYNCDKGGDLPPISLDPEEEIKKKYTRKKIYDAVMMYFNGKIERAIQELQKLKVVERDREIVDQARELDNLVRIVKGKYAQGLTDLRRGKYETARAQFEIALKTDAKFIPEGLTSFYKEDIGKQLAERLYRDGKEYFDRQKWFKAFPKWDDCLMFSPDDQNCLGGMMKLEKVASEAMEMADRLVMQGQLRKAIGVLEDVKRITRPKSMPHQTAILRIREIELKLK
ncbi:MAG: FHA domain-containing protein [Deltaproteobacteria bacterium]|nr:FHA domain-containing protein [Deltaproteobacteria bacterium]